jgi:hypothetical protein
LSLTGLSRQSRTTDGASIARAVVMDARNKCGHDRKVGEFEVRYPSPSESPRQPFVKHDGASLS